MGWWMDPFNATSHKKKVAMWEDMSFKNQDQRNQTNSLVKKI